MKLKHPEDMTGYMKAGTCEATSMEPAEFIGHCRNVAILLASAGMGWENKLKKYFEITGAELEPEIRSPSRELPDNAAQG